jgi:hypothetical protein
MKTSTWIKLIGILCIIFGASGILEDISSLFIPLETGIVKSNLPELPQTLQKFVPILKYLNLLAHAFYFLAGIFFLIKKPFSIKIMYMALTFSILCRIVPMLFLSQYNISPFFNYNINISNLLGPFIDVVLLFGVYRISGYYFKSPEELAELTGEKKKQLTPRLLKILTIIGIFCFSVPLSLFVLWGYLSGAGNNQAYSVEKFKSYFPPFLQGQYDTTYLSLCFCIAAIILSSIGMTSSKKLWKGINIFILAVSILMLLLNLFSLM